MKLRGICLPIFGLLALTWTVVLATSGAPSAQAQRSPQDGSMAVRSVEDTSGGKEQSRVKLVLAGSSGPNRVSVSWSKATNTYAIDSSGPLEIGAPVCANPADNPNQLICDAAPIVSVQVNAWTGDDQVRVSRSVRIPVVLLGGPGNDLLAGGEGPDRLIGGSGRDVLVGHRGRDFLSGGTQSDFLFGGPGNDLLFGGPGLDRLLGGGGHDRELRRKGRSVRVRARVRWSSAVSGPCCARLPATP